MGGNAIRGLLTFLGLLSGLAAAQEYGGTYVADGDLGVVTLTLRANGDTLAGTLAGGGSSFTLEGYVYEEGAAGEVYGGDAPLGFEIYLQGETLGLYIFDLGANGEAITGSTSEILLTRQATAGETGPAPGADDPVGLGGPVPEPPAAEPPGGGPAAASNPLAGAAGDPQGRNPLGRAPTDPFTGTFAGDGLVLVLEPGAGVGRYEGQLTFEGQEYPLTAEADAGAGVAAQGTAAEGGTLGGTFLTGGQAFEFCAVVADGTLVLETGGARYTLRKEAAGNEAGNGTAGPRSVPSADDPVLARGQGTDLTQDDANAFLEALEFSLAQVGYAYEVTGADRRQLLEALVQTYPSATAEDQQILSRAREIWSDAESRWPSMGEADRKAFLLAVFVLAFGEATVQAWVGPAGSGGQGGDLGGDACGSFEDCTSRFVDGDTWSDTFNTQSCWASAGCGGFDAGTDTFDYDTP